MAEDSLQAPVTLLITTGEPAGIGPDVLLKWWNKCTPDPELHIITIADPVLLADRSRQLGLNIHFHEIQGPDDLPSDRGKLPVLPCKLDAPVVAGKLDPANAPYVIRTLEMACDLNLARKVDATVTGPVQKSVINDAGIPFSGHTEFFAQQCHSNNPGDTPCDPVMMLATPGLRVALVTTHLPLRRVADQITAEKLLYCLDTLHQSLIREFGISAPEILVTGLNPHAGEHGHLGHEEQETIIPVVDACRKNGMHITGPLPADTLFTPKYLDKADAVLAMYHDQGLPVLKHLGFGRAVNITLGLPIVRTSVDHGTALDLAGTGEADEGSFDYALQCAAEIARRHKIKARSNG